MSVAGHDTFGVCCVLHAFAYQIENRSVFGASDEINMGKTRFLPQKTTDRTCFEWCNRRPAHTDGSAIENDIGLFLDLIRRLDLLNK